MGFLALFIGGIMTVVVTLCYILLISFTIWMAVDAGKQDRFWWLTFVIGVPVIGPAAYYFTEKKHEYARAPVHHVHQSETEEQHEKAPKKRKSHKKMEEKKEEPKQEAVKEEQKEEVKQEVVNDEVTLEELVEGENTPASS